MLSVQCSQSMLWPCLPVLLLHGFGCAENSLADFTGLPEGFVTGDTTAWRSGAEAEHQPAPA